jgi:hypothetical protein
VEALKSEAYCGAIAGMIKEIVSVREVMRSIISSYNIESKRGILQIPFKLI